MNILILKLLLPEGQRKEPANITENNRTLLNRNSFLHFVSDSKVLNTLRLRPCPPATHYTQLHHKYKQRLLDYLTDVISLSLLPVCYPISSSNFCFCVPKFRNVFFCQALLSSLCPIFLLRQPFCFCSPTRVIKKAAISSLYPPCVTNGLLPLRLQVSDVLGCTGSPNLPQGAVHHH